MENIIKLIRVGDKSSLLKACVLLSDFQDEQAVKDSGIIHKLARFMVRNVKKNVHSTTIIPIPCDEDISEIVIEMMKRCLEMGVDVNYTDNRNGWTTLQFSLDSGNWWISKFLLENGASADVVSKVDLNMVDQGTTLHTLCYGVRLNERLSSSEDKKKFNGKALDVAKLLLAKNIDPSIKSSWGNTCCDILKETKTSITPDLQKILS